MTQYPMTHWACGTSALGVLIDGLDPRHKLPESLSVDTPLGWMEPTHLTSYRGYYEHLAIVVRPNWTSEPLDTAGLREVLTRAVGSDFHGYKGGTYRMTRNTPVWVVLDYSTTSSLLATHVEIVGDTALVRTAICDD